MKNHVKLYKLGKNNRILEYEIFSEDGLITIHANGSTYYEEVKEGKAGRTLEEQVRLRVKSRLKKKLDSGFKKTIEEAKAGPTSQLNKPLPMLAERIDKIKHIPTRVMIQPKLDGHRCLICSEFAYSRKGLEIPTAQRIVDALDLPEYFILDGEFYAHGVPLQTIGSWIKRDQVDSKNLKFHAYDLINLNDHKMPFRLRYQILTSIINESNARGMIELVSTKSIVSTNISKAFKIYRDAGYEGAIARDPEGTYDIGYRSKGLLKVKQFLDAEFKCVGMHTNDLGWAILHFVTDDGKEFTATAPGTVDEKIHKYTIEEEYLNRMFTIEFANYTNDGIPFQPVCLRPREDI